MLPRNHTCRPWAGRGRAVAVAATLPMDIPARGHRKAIPLHGKERSTAPGPWHPVEGTCTFAAFSLRFMNGVERAGGALRVPGCVVLMLALSVPLCVDV